IICCYYPVSHRSRVCGIHFRIRLSPLPSSPPYNFYAVLLVLLIFCVVFGNVLVCVAVSRERALQTTTNYLIVSLAVSDLLTCNDHSRVLLFILYFLIHCDILLTLDVMMCTASILNLCAISIDRYTAVAMPMLYNTRYSSRRRVALMIAVVWFLSFAISCPLLFGLNNTGLSTNCAFADPSFVVYSSVASFYVPFIVTLLVYAQICVVLRRRGRRTGSLSFFSPSFPPPSSPCISPPALLDVSEGGGGAPPGGGKERKATQMLACSHPFILLPPSGVFIICWLPFFLTHVLKAHCGSCCISPSLYSAVTWLGYLNSAVNPVIYTTFNIEFRKAFIKILNC
uniref:G-protein coupled receptors family 1 profile domain-containing protein n=1 Tax=Hucho hucho TaxID=62062 RepID=A0A4W5NQA6_9TELE